MFVSFPLFLVLSAASFTADPNLSNPVSHRWGRGWSTSVTCKCHMTCHTWHKSAGVSQPLSKEVVLDSCPMSCGSWKPSQICASSGGGLGLNILSSLCLQAIASSHLYSLAFPQTENPATPAECVCVPAHVQTRHTKQGTPYIRVGDLAPGSAFAPLRPTPGISFRLFTQHSSQPSCWLFSLSLFSSPCL